MTKYVHRGNGKVVIKRPHIKSNVVLVTYDDFTTEQMSVAVFESLHKKQDVSDENADRENG